MISEFKSLLEALSSGNEAVLERTADGGSYMRRFRPPERLILLGAGHVSQAVSPFAEPLDFSVTVVDDRPSFANRVNFPHADRILCGDFVKTIRSSLSISERDYVCILTRGHRWDMECLRAILTGDIMPRYLGMMGSHRRIAATRKLLAEEGFPTERLNRLHAPIGIPIRALTPKEIAVSIVAELISVRRENPPDFDSMQQTDVPFELLHDLAEALEPRVLCMVLDTFGSTPAGSGALMTVDRAGRLHGTVGGGCGEAQVIRRAQRILGTGSRDIITVDMTSETEEAAAMVCGGTMKLLLDDLTPEADS